MPTPSPSRTGARTSPAGVALVVAGQCSVHVGAAIAALLFPVAGVAGVVTLRLVVAAVVLMLVTRPRVRGYARADWVTIGAFAVALAGMNTFIYQAFERIPIGIAVTIEVLGPLVLSIVTGRGAARWAWVGLALAGVALLGGGGFARADGLDPVGVAWALAAAALWAAYIVFSARTGARFPKADGLALAMTGAAVLVLPWGILGAGAVLLDPRTLGLGAAVAVLSSVLPYSFEMAALRRLPTTTFALLMSFGPVLAALAGFLVLGQVLAVVQVVAIGLVVLACAGAVVQRAPG